MQLGCYHSILIEYYGESERHSCTYTAVASGGAVLRKILRTEPWTPLEVRSLSVRYMM